ncbi:MAG: RluA family pseudouridine synthase [Rickettsiales bacterium]
MNDKTHNFTVSESESGIRLDKFLNYHLPDMSRTRIQALISGGYVSCEGKTIESPAVKTKINDEYHIVIPKAEPSRIEPQKMNLDIVYEDPHLLVVNKPAGLTVHPAPGNRENTLVNALLAHCGDSLSGIGGVARPGIVHRIDKDTSGLLIVAKDDITHNHLSAQLANRTLGRTYNAIVWDTLNPKYGTIETNIGRSRMNRQKMAVLKTSGKPAITNYKTIENFGIASLIECRLESGRTHQIRVHLTHIGNPLIGDPVYGQTTKSRLNKKIYRSLPENTIAALQNFTRQALHATELHFIHPKTNKEMSFSCPLPNDMVELLDALKI